MTQDGDSRSSNEPKSSRERVGNDCEWDGQNDESSIELCRGGTEETNIKVTTLELADTVHATDDKKNNKGKKPVGEQSIDTQHDKEDGIVASKVAQVVVDSVLDLTEVLRLGKSLQVEELGQWLQVGEAA